MESIFTRTKTTFRPDIHFGKYGEKGRPNIGEAIPSSIPKDIVGEKADRNNEGAT